MGELCVYTKVRSAKCAPLQLLWLFYVFLISAHSMTCSKVVLVQFSLGRLLLSRACKICWHTSFLLFTVSDDCIAAATVQLLLVHCVCVPFSARFFRCVLSPIFLLSLFLLLQKKKKLSQNRSASSKLHALSKALSRKWASRRCSMQRPPLI